MRFFHQNWIIGRVCWLIDNKKNHMATNTSRYTDLDLNFPMNPLTHDVGKRVDRNAIVTSLKNLIKTRNFERPFHPEIGSQVHSLLFEGNSSATIAALERGIKYTIDNFEPRVELLLVRATPSDRSVAIDITYRIVALNEVQNAKFDLVRIL